jgi:hypothetical protein
MFIISLLMCTILITHLLTSCEKQFSYDIVRYSVFYVNLVVLLLSGSKTKYSNIIFNNYKKYIDSNIKKEIHNSELKNYHIIEEINGEYYKVVEIVELPIIYGDYFLMLKRYTKEDN